MKSKYFDPKVTWYLAELKLSEFYFWRAQHERVSVFPILSTYLLIFFLKREITDALIDFSHGSAFICTELTSN